MNNIFNNRSILLKLLISAVITVVMVMRLDLHELKNLLHDIYPASWLMALSLIFVQILALSYRWVLLVNVQERKIDYPDSVRVTLASLLANYLFITSVGGLVVRVALTIQSKVPLSIAIAATVLDRFMTLAALVILAILFMPVLAGIVDKALLINTLGLVLAVIAASVALPFFVFKNIRRRRLFEHRKIAIAFKYLRSIVRNSDLLAKITAAGLIAQVAYFGAVYVIVLSTGAAFSPLLFMAVLPMIAIVASLPLGYGGWGIREGAFVYGLGLIHIPYEAAFLASVQIGLISMLAALLAGLPALLSDKTQFGLKNWKASRAA